MFVHNLTVIKLYEIFTGIIDIDIYPKVKNNTVSVIIQITKTAITAKLPIKTRFKDAQNFWITTTLTAKNNIYTGLVLKENMAESIKSSLFCSKTTVHYDSTSS